MCAIFISFLCTSPLLCGISLVYEWLYTYMLLNKFNIMYENTTINVPNTILLRTLATFTKLKKTDICAVPHSKKLTGEVLRCGSHSFHTANTPHLPLPVAFHQRAPLLCVVIAAIWLQLTTHLSTPRGWKAELADLQRAVYPYKLLPVSCRSSADLWKFTGQRPTFYHWATPLTSHTHTPDERHSSRWTAILPGEPG